MTNKIEAITSAEMSSIDTNCAYHGLSTIQLMENAGSGLANVIKKRFEKGKITFITGRGNNGGDAFVASRHLKNFDCSVILLGSSKDIRTKESRRNFDIIKKSGFLIKEIRDSSDLGDSLLKDSDIVVDAIFGTGIKGKIREPESTAIDMINASKAFVLSVDVPSGLDPDTGSGLKDKSVHADLTVTFHRMKKGLLDPSAKKNVGKIEVSDIGIPNKMEMLTGPGDINLVHKRSTESHKGDNGRVLIIGGGPFFGAPTLSAFAALRAGADWVTVATPKSVYPIVSSFSPDLIVKELSSDVLIADDLPKISVLIEDHDVVVIGMGLGNDKETVKAVKSIIKKSDKVVIDADGLYGLNIPQKKKKVIITPHLGEFSKIGVKTSDLKNWGIDDKIDFIEDFSFKNNLVVLMKGKEDIISDGSRTKVNKSGNFGMTVGGTGDVLSGIAGALFATNDDPFYVSTASAFLSGAAGDLAFEERGFCLLATDVVEKIPEVLP